MSLYILRENVPFFASSQWFTIATGDRIPSRLRTRQSLSYRTPRPALPPAGMCFGFHPSWAIPNVNVVAVATGDRRINLAQPHAPFSGISVPEESAVVCSSDSKPGATDHRDAREGGVRWGRDCAPPQAVAHGRQADQIPRTSRPAPRHEARQDSPTALVYQEVRGASFPRDPAGGWAA